MFILAYLLFDELHLWLLHLDTCVNLRVNDTTKKNMFENNAMKFRHLNCDLGVKMLVL